MLMVEGIAPKRKLMVLDAISIRVKTFLCGAKECAKLICQGIVMLCDILLYVLSMVSSEVGMSLYIDGLSWLR